MSNYHVEHFLCRCCHTQSYFKTIGNCRLNEDGHQETFKRLEETFNISIPTMGGQLTCTICDDCLERLQEAAIFKQQVLECELKLQAIINTNTVTVKKEPDLDQMEDEQNSAELQLWDGEDNTCLDAEEVYNNSQEKKQNILKVKTENKIVKPTQTEQSESKEVSLPEKGKGGSIIRIGDDYAREGKVYFCKRCDKRYLSRCSLRIHIQKFHFNIDAEHRCSICSKRFENSNQLVIHKRIAHFIDNRVQCKECSSLFDNQKLLQIHLKNFHNIGQRYKCDLCEYESHKVENLRRHKVRHTGERNFQCNYCEKTFMRKATLMQHERIHTGDKRKVCKVCGESFVQKASLNYHMAKYHFDLVLSDTNSVRSE